MKNLDKSALPWGKTGRQGETLEFGKGFSRRERACIDLRIPESGDTELDALIEKAQRQEMAGKAMQGLLCAPDLKLKTYANVATHSAVAADDLLAELERTNG